MWQIKYSLIISTEITECSEMGASDMRILIKLATFLWVRKYTPLWSKTPLHLQPAQEEQYSEPTVLDPRATIFIDKWCTLHTYNKRGTLVEISLQYEQYHLTFHPYALHIAPCRGRNDVLSLYSTLSAWEINMVFHILPLSRHCL